MGPASLRAPRAAGDNSPHNAPTEKGWRIVCPQGTKPSTQPSGRDFWRIVHLGLGAEDLPNRTREASFGAVPPRYRRPPDRDGTAHATLNQHKQRRRRRAAGGDLPAPGQSPIRCDRGRALNPRDRLARARLEGGRVEDDHVLGDQWAADPDAVHAGELERSVLAGRVQDPGYEPAGARSRCRLPPR
jgi:hypothetical protein